MVAAQALSCLQKSLYVGLVDFESMLQTSGFVGRASVRVPPLLTDSSSPFLLAAIVDSSEDAIISKSLD